MADYAQINNNRSTAPGYYTSKQYANGTGSDFGDVLKAQEDKSAQAKASKAESEEDTDYMKQLQEHMEEMMDKIKHGTIQPKIQIGAQEYTQEEWKKLLEKFDEAEEDLVEQMKAEIEALKEQAAKEKEEMEEAAKAEIKSESEKAVDSPA